MTRRNQNPGTLKQQSLIGFLEPDPSKTSSPPTRSRKNRSRTKPGPTRRTTRVPLQLSQHSGPSDTDSGVDTIHFEPRKVDISDDDVDIQLSSPARRRRTVDEVESHPGYDTLTSNDSDESVGASRKATPSIKVKRPIARSPSTEPESPAPKRRRLARGVRPSSPEEPDNLLGEVNEAGNYLTKLRKVTTDIVHRHHPVSLS